MSPNPPERRQLRPVARLLIVDDEQVQLQALCATLQHHGYETEGCSNAEQALAALRAGSFDMLLTDLMMPGTDGLALLRDALEVDPSLAMVMLTGEGSIGTAVAAMRSGAIDYLLKPFKLSALLPVIERGLAMRQLRLENAALELRVRRHVAELEAANQELDAFTRSASHDLRSPLNAVLGFAMLLRRHSGGMTADQLQWIGDIERSAHRMNRLIDDLMRLSRLGRQALSPRPVALAPLVQGVIDEMRQQYPAHEARVSCGPLPEVAADDSLLRQVFVNLLSNAFKFTTGTALARIEIGCETLSDEQVFFVRDNGPGFDMAQATALFQAFQRLHRIDQFEGSGVGLTIVQRIVQRHGGRVWAEAAPQQGACFYFTLAPQA